MIGEGKRAHVSYFGPGPRTLSRPWVLIRGNTVTGKESHRCETARFYIRGSPHKVSFENRRLWMDGNT